MSHSRLKIYNTLALPTLLNGTKTGVIREQDKSRIMPAEMKFMRRMAKYAWQDHKTSEIFCQNFKLKITEMNGYNVFDTLNDEMSTILPTKPRMTPEKTS